MTLIEKTLAAVEKYSTATGLKPGTITLYAINSTAFYERLKRGAAVTSVNCERVLDYVRRHPARRRREKATWKQQPAA